MSDGKTDGMHLYGVEEACAAVEAGHPLAFDALTAEQIRAASPRALRYLMKVAREHPNASGPGWRIDSDGHLVILGSP